MSELAEAAQHATDETGEIRTDLACQRCGYNLRGLNATGLCPECGTPISLSLHKDLLCFAEPEYVKGLARGCRRILGGLTLLFGCFILVLPGGLVAGLVLTPTSATWNLLTGIAGSLGIIAAVIGVLAFVYGVWLITGPQPRVFTTPKRDMARRLVRVYLLVGIIGNVLIYSIEAFGPPPGVMALFALLGFGVSVFGVIGITVYFMYLRNLAQRVSMTSHGRYLNMPEHAKALAYGFAIVLGWFALANAVGAFSSWGYAILVPGGLFDAPGAVVGVCISAAAALALLILFLVAARLHYRLRAALTREAAQAAEHWGEAST